MTDIPGEPGAGAEGRGAYARRWVGHAFRTVRDWLELHVGVLVAAFLGPTVGNFAYAYVTADPKDFDLATQALRSLVIGLVGTAVLFAVAFLIQMLRTPGELAKSATRAAGQRVDALEQDLAESKATVDRQRSEMDSTRIREIEMAHEGHDLVSVDTGASAREAWLEAERNRYREGYKAKVAEDEARSRPFLVVSVAFGGETRSVDEFLQELKTYFEALNTNWVEALRAGTIRQEVARLRLAVRNPTDVSIEGLEIQVTLPADVGAGWDEDAELGDEVLDKPQMWGRETLYSLMPNVHGTFIQPDPGRIERVAGRLVVTWDRFDLSGLARHPLSPVALFVPGEYAGSTLRVEWSAAARRLRGVISHTLDVAVAPASIVPGDVLDDPDPR